MDADTLRRIIAGSHLVAREDTHLSDEEKAATAAILLNLALSGTNFTLQTILVDCAQKAETEKASKAEKKSSDSGKTKQKIGFRPEETA